MDASLPWKPKQQQRRAKHNGQYWAFKRAIRYVEYILTVFTATSFVSRRTATIESVNTIQTCSTVQTGITRTLIYIWTKQETACTALQSQIKFILSFCGLSGSIRVVSFYLCLSYDPTCQNFNIDIPFCAKTSCCWCCCLDWRFVYLFDAENEFIFNWELNMSGWESIASSLVELEFKFNYLHLASIIEHDFVSYRYKLPLGC